MTTCIILAAGNSKRFGSAKMLYPLASGVPMLGVTINIYKQVFEHVNVVVQTGDEDIRLMVEAAGANVIRCDDAERGMSLSLISAIKAHADSERWLIALGDMPYVSPSTLLLMLNEQNDIVAPRHESRIGNPVIFSYRFKSQLLRLSGDKGGRSIIQDNRQSLGLVDVDDAGVLHDIDVPGDIKRY